MHFSISGLITAKVRKPEKLKRVAGLPFPEVRYSWYRVAGASISTLPSRKAKDPHGVVFLPLLFASQSGADNHLGRHDRKPWEKIDPHVPGRPPVIRAYSGWESGGLPDPRKRRRRYMGPSTKRQNLWEKPTHSVFSFPSSFFRHSCSSLPPRNAIAIVIVSSRITRGLSKFLRCCHLMLVAGVDCQACAGSR